MGETACPPNTPEQQTSILCYGCYLWDAAHSKEEHGESLGVFRIANDRGTEAGCDDEVGRETQRVIAVFSAFSWARPRFHKRRSFA
jgi:hypothetical protein